jgi:Rieske Fe-S protein
MRDALHAVALFVGLNTLLPWRELSALTVGTNGVMRYPLPATDGVSIDTKNEVILCRFQNEVFAFALACPHQNTALRALPKNAGFQCPRHKSRYQPNGTFVNGKATRNMDRLPITREGNEIVVNTAVAYASDKDLAQWTAAVVKL